MVAVGSLLIHTFNSKYTTDKKSSIETSNSNTNGITNTITNSMWGRTRWKTTLIDAANALPGRSQATFTVSSTHAVNGNPTLSSDFPSNMKLGIFGMGCFWGAERLFWQLNGVYSTQVGYSGGFTPHPTYNEVCTGMTGHTEVVRVVYDPSLINYNQLLKIFWESHDPTQGMRQGNDVGTQYRSIIYYFDDKQKELALESKKNYENVLGKTITTEIDDADKHIFYYAEDYHQQYLSDRKNPYGYCGLKGTGVECPINVNNE